VLPNFIFLGKYNISFSPSIRLIVISVSIYLSCGIGWLQASQEEKTLLVVAGENYQTSTHFPFFIDPVLRGQLESEGWRIGECRWSELTSQTASQFRVLVFLQTPNLPSLNLESNALFLKMQTITNDHLAAGGSVVIFADQFRGRIQPVLDAWLQPYGIRVSSYQLTVTSPTNRIEGYPSFSWTPDAMIPVDAPFEAGRMLGVPQGNDLSFLLRMDGNWQVLLEGPETTVPVPAAATGLAPGELPWSGRYTIAAGRTSGSGKLVVCGSHSSFWMLNPYHEVWDSGALMTAGGLDFVRGLLNWTSTTTANGPGGFSGGVVDARADRAENVRPQRGSFPANAKRGVIGVDPGNNASKVASFSTRARALGLDYLVFTANGTLASNSTVWNQLVAACEAATGDGFRALPGVAFTSPETGNQAVAFNFKKPWPEIPWQSGAFESLVRVGVNNDFDSMLILRRPERAPIPLHNAGAVNGVEVHNSNANHVAVLQRGGWPLLPVRVADVMTLAALDAAAATPTTLHISKWDELGASGFEKITKSSVGKGTVRRFEVDASSAWPEDGLLRGTVRFQADGLSDGGRVALFSGDRLLMARPVSGGAVDIEWSGTTPGWAQFHIEGITTDGSPPLRASGLAVSQAAFATSIGSDLMNGYLYPAVRATAETAGSVRVSGAHAIVGTTVYPQLGWGGHWLFRTLTQQAEPLGFEIGSPAGGIFRLTSGYRWRQSGTLHNLAPKRSVALNSSGVIVWKDLDVRLKKQAGSDGNRTIWNEAVPGVSTSMRTTAFRWWDHAALLFEPKANLSTSSAEWGQSANIAALSLNEDFNVAATIRVRHGGNTITVPLGGEVVLPAGAGATLGDRPSGMVSLWALGGPLRLRVVESSGRPMLELWQDPSESSSREAAFILVISAHRPGLETTLEEVESAIFQQRFFRSPNNALGQYLETLDVSRSRGMAATLQGSGSYWRGRISGLSRDSEGAVWWNHGGKARRQEIPWGDGESANPVLVENVPSTRVFAGNTFTANRTGLRVWTVPAANDSEPWTIFAHNIRPVAQDVTLSTHPLLDGIVAPWSVTTTLAPGETKSWSHLPHVPEKLKISSGSFLGSVPTGSPLSGLQVAAVGGNGSLSWSLASGVLPAGTSLNATTGRFEGTPLTAGWHSFRVTVQDQSAVAISRNFLLLTHAVGPEPAENGSDSLPRPDARSGVRYRSTLAEAGFTLSGTGLTFRKISGPSWLEISPSGALSGLPSVSDIGSNAFVVGLGNARGTVQEFTLRIEVAKKSQSIGRLVAPSNRVYSPQPIPITLPAASSGLLVVLSVKSGPATLSGNSVVPQGAGTVVLAVNQSGNATIAPAREVRASFTISKAAQRLPAFPIFDRQNQGTPLAVEMPVSSGGLPAVLSVKSGDATLSGGFLHFHAPGSVVLAANQAGNEAYMPATERVRAIVVGAPFGELHVVEPNPFLGTVGSEFLGRTLREIGTGWTIAATPAPGMRFRGWLKNGQPLAGSRFLAFAMEPGLRLEALFGPNFPALTGNYTGLVGDGAIEGESSEERAAFPQENGFVRIALASSGQFTANVTIEGRSLTANGSFGNSTQSSMSIPRPEGGAIALSLQAHPVLPGEISGTVDLGEGPLPFHALRDNWLGGAPVHPLSGRRYRFELTGGQSGAHRFGTLVVGSKGDASLALILENGVRRTIRQSLLDAGPSGWVLPFHSVYAKGLVQGELAIDRLNPDSISGQLEWLGEYIPGNTTEPVGMLWPLEVGKSLNLGAYSGPLPKGSALTIPFRLHLPDGSTTATLNGNWSSGAVELDASPTLPGLTFTANLSGQITGSYQMLIGATRTKVWFHGWAFPPGLQPLGTSPSTLGVGHVVTPRGAFPLTLETP
jgi:hypothetical protein